MGNLCEYCRQIPFSTLRCPTAVEIREVRHAQRNRLPSFRSLHFRSSLIKGPDYKSTETSVPLGPIARILRYVGPCELCHLFGTIIKQRGTRYLYDRPIPEDDDNLWIEAAIDMEYYAYISESIRDIGSSSPDGLTILRRLSLRVLYKKDTVVDGVLIENWKSLAFYNKVLQICHPDDFAPSSHPQAMIQAEHESISSRMLFRGRMRPDVVDLDLLRQWMRICETDHDITCCSDEEFSINNPRATAVKLIRFIDVDKNCLCILRDVDLTKLPNRYAALSYVWGNAVQVKLGGSNEMSLQVKDSLSKFTLPQTISDAIHLTRLLAIKFLWVDVLCICQGQTDFDLRDRQDQLNNMGNIYHQASLTIIVACGDNVNAGLSGLHPHTRNLYQKSVTVIPPNEDRDDPGLAVVSTCNHCPVWTGFEAIQRPDDDEIDVSIWATRTWTVQERCLSRRCLVFTKGQVFWVCDGAIFCEESHFEPPKIYERDSTDTPLRIELWKQRGTTLAFKTIDGPLSRLTTTRQTFWQKYSRLVESYSNTQMSFSGDVFNAFQGIAEALGRISGEQFHWGHPKSRFGVSLAWSSPAYYYKLHRRTEKTTLPMTSLKTHVNLPSWSWMGWMGPVNVSVGDDKFETETLNFLCFSHQSYPIRIIPITGRNRLDEQYSGAPIEKPDSGRKKGTLLSRDENGGNITWNDIQKHHPDLTESRLRTVPDGHVIFFWASSAFLIVERPEHTGSEAENIAIYGSPILSPESSSIDAVNGIVKTPRAAVKSTEGLLVGTVDRMDKEHWNSSPSPSGLQEFVVVGRKEIQEMAEVYPPYVVALQIRWENGIAYRVNVAEFKELDWMKAQPTWKMIPLM